jgi:hypothetical protein
MGLPLTFDAPDVFDVPGREGALTAPPQASRGHLGAMCVGTRSFKTLSLEFWTSSCTVHDARYSEPLDPNHPRVAAGSAKVTAFATRRLDCGAIPSDAPGTRQCTVWASRLRLPSLCPRGPAKPGPRPSAGDASRLRPRCARIRRGHADE